MPWIVSGLEKKSFQLITPWFRQSQWCSSRPVQGTRAWSCGLDSVKHVANSGTAIPCLATSWQTSGEASQIFTSNRLAWSIISLGQRRLRQPFSDLIIVRARLVVISIKKSLPIIPGWKFKQKKNKFKVKKNIFGNSKSSNQQKPAWLFAETQSAEKQIWPSHESVGIHSKYQGKSEKFEKFSKTQSAQAGLRDYLGSQSKRIHHRNVFKII